MDWNGISTSPKLKLEWIEQFIDKDWEWYDISLNKNCVLDWIKKYPDGIGIITGRL